MNELTASTAERQGPVRPETLIRSPGIAKLAEYCGPTSNANLLEYL